MAGSDDARLPKQVGEPAARHSAPATVRRRELLIAVSTLAAFFGLPAAARSQVALSSAIDPSAFRELTGILTGMSPSDATLPELFLQAFSADAADLGKLHAIVTEQPETEWDSAIASAGLKPLSESLIQAWYTGSVMHGSEERVLTYLDAFVWHACGYTKPPTRCDTNFGAWANAPPPGRFSE
ncbi:sorbitol dehydrogenase family protein [Mesorhizobium sp. M1312]|uniref:sugar dehydrogenase complex small subunit n=1 Tax=unclassified Mesorhizobium TaxID=325217 RepID=UPI003336A1CB